MFSFLTVFEGDIAIGIACLVVGVLFSTKITDFFKGIPGDLRTALNGVEQTTVANVKAAQASVIAKLPMPAAKAPAAPLAPVTPVPAAPVPPAA